MDFFFVGCSKVGCQRVSENWYRMSERLICIASRLPESLVCFVCRVSEDASNNV